MTLFWLGVGIVFYYVVLYVITKTFLRILSIKRQYLWRSVLLIIESIPVFVSSITCIAGILLFV